MVRYKTNSGIVEKPSVHFRLFESEATIVSDELNLVHKASKFLGLTISEFCRTAAIEKARLTLLKYRKDKLLLAKKILLEEELRTKKEKLENEEKNDG